MSAILYWIAAGVSALTVIVHVFAGGVKFVRPLLAADIPAPLKWMSYLGWHTASITLVLVTAGFVVAALSPAHGLLAIQSTVLAAALALLAIYIAAKAKLPPARFPVIPLFSLVAAIGAAGIFLG